MQLEAPISTAGATKDRSKQDAYAPILEEVKHAEEALRSRDKVLARKFEEVILTKYLAERFT